MPQLCISVCACVERASFGEDFKWGHLGGIEMRPSEHEPSVCWKKKKRTEKDRRSELPSIRDWRRRKWQGRPGQQGWEQIELLLSEDGTAHSTWFARCVLLRNPRSVFRSLATVCVCVYEHISHILLSANKSVPPATARRGHLCWH